MSQSHYHTREKWNVLRDFWLTASTSPEGELRLEMPSFREAMNLRADLYRVVRRTRRQNPHDELLQAVLRCSINIEPGSSTLIIYQRALPQALTQLKGKVDSISADNSAKRLQEQLQASGFVTPPIETGKKHNYF